VQCIEFEGRKDTEVASVSGLWTPEAGAASAYHLEKLSISLELRQGCLLRALRRATPTSPHLFRCPFPTDLGIAVPSLFLVDLYLLSTASLLKSSLAFK
jgi:hypothetical protein